MEDPTQLGRNRTGMQMSPLHSEMLEQTSDDVLPLSNPSAVMQPEATLAAELRREYVNDAEALGSVPPPLTLKGAAKSGAGALTGHRTQVLVDKIAERLAYERGGTRLYEAALVKVLAHANGTPVSVERVKQIRDQEMAHATLLQNALVKLGADPTAQTPCADLVGVQAMGLIQAVTDPRTDLVQTLSSLLAAELIDVASWDLLARLARTMGQEELAASFDAALIHENEHLESISRWYEALVISESKLLS
jgi:bacterioferritin (cytochrome b1)